jgi:cell pole-organizing protein PopZ
VRELVKPMLRSWLDAKLGEILNRLVQAELNKALEEVSAS